MMQVVAEVRLAVFVILASEEDVGVPHLVHGLRRAHVLLRFRLAEREEAPVPGFRLIEFGLVPVGMVELDALHHVFEIENGECRVQLGAAVESDGSRFHHDLLVHVNLLS